MLRDRKVLNEKIEELHLTLDMLQLHRKVPVGTTMQKDCTCDSMYMLKNIRRIGMAIRKTYYWVEKEKIIHWIMDSAGRHGTNNAKKEYETILMDECANC